MDRMTVTAGVLALLALTPSEWVENLGAWGVLLSAARPVAALGLGLLVVGVVVLLLRRSTSPIEVISPGGVPEDSFVRRVLDILESLDGNRHHTVRIVVITGSSTINYLRQILTTQQLRGHWDIKVLIMSPDAPAVDDLENGSSQNIAASLVTLGQLKAKALAHRWPCTLRWTTYDDPPMMRGFVIDDEHLFLGHTAWRNGTLTDQDRHLIPIRRGPDWADLKIECFTTWFDRTWQQCPQAPDGEAA